MRCFIHTAREGVAVCLTCGKCMCMSCSAVDSHSGVCPNCTRNSLQASLSENRRLRSSFTAKLIVFVSLFAVFAAAATVYLLASMPDPAIDLSVVVDLIPFEWLHYVIAGVFGVLALLFLILTLVAIGKRAPAARAIAQIESRITEINISIGNEPAPLLVETLSE